MTAGLLALEEFRFLCECECFQLTIGLAALWSSALAGDTVLLEVEVPALGGASLVGEGEGEDALGGLDSGLALLGVGLERVVDQVKGSGRRERVWWFLRQYV